MRNPFYIGLVTFEEDFLGLSDYIEKFISTIRTEEQKKILIYIALCYHFEQKSLPANLFAILLNKAGTDKVSEWDKIDLKKHFNFNLELLLIKEKYGKFTHWWPRHYLYAEELLRQLLGKKEEVDNFTYRSILAQ